MRETITLTKPKKQTPITSADPDKIPVNKRTKVPPAYVYCHYEQCWEFDYVDGNGWIPLLCKIVAVPGCNGVPQSGSLSGVLQVIAQKGGTVIDPNDRKLIEPGADENTSEWYRYPRFFETDENPPRKYWVEPGEEPTITLAGQILWDREQVRKTASRFRAHLRDAGIVRPMHPIVLQTELTRERAAIDRIQSRVGRNPHLQAEVDAKTARLSQMVESFEKMTANDFETGTTLKTNAAKRGPGRPKAKRGQP